MRAKRSKQYRKLMQRYGQTFGFREPYQVLVDAAVLLDAARFKMNFVALLQNTLHGTIKPMITQCSMRHLYATSPKNETVEMVIEHAKNFERRRCNHHELEKPLSTMECLHAVIDPKDNKRNKNRYVVATQDETIREYLRTIPGVPLIYIKRSVMIMEPMAMASERIRNSEEQTKIRGQDARDGASALKRRAHDDANLSDGQSDIKRIKTRKGPKQPNPLSVPRPKQRADQRADSAERISSEDATEQPKTLKRRRTRQHHASKQGKAAASHISEPALLEPT